MFIILHTVRCLRTGFRHKRTVARFDDGYGPSNIEYDLTKDWCNLNIDPDSPAIAQFDYHPKHISIANRCELNKVAGKNLLRFLTLSASDQNYYEYPSDRNFVTSVTNTDCYRQIPEPCKPGDILYFANFTPAGKRKRYFGLYLMQDLYMTKPYDNSGIYIGTFDKAAPKYINGEPTILTFLTPGHIFEQGSSESDCDFQYNLLRKIED